MKLLCVSSDRSQLEWLLKRLLRCRIPCAVCKQGDDSELGIWIQRDTDFPLALNIFADRDRTVLAPAQESRPKRPEPATEETWRQAEDSVELVVGECAAAAA